MSASLFATQPTPLCDAGFSPVRIIEIEISRPIPDIPAVDARTGQEYRQGLALIRLHHQPLGAIRYQLSQPGMPASALASLIWQTLGAQINRHLQVDRLPPVSGLPLDGLLASKEPGCLETLNAALTAPPFVSVIVCSRERAKSLAACLNSLRSLEYPRFEVVLVDNAPLTSETADLASELSTEMPQLTYVRENRPGLSAARNAGLRKARGEIIAFTDDDVVVDRFWLAEIVHGFSTAPEAACITGLAFPAEIETPAQELMEEYGGMGKGFERRLFDLNQHKPVTPLYPYSVGWLGVGANMSFRADVLRSLGGFDPATGTGTPAQGGEDLAIFYQVVTAGYSLVYQPSALVWHYHRRSYEGFRKQAFAYGVGLTAYLTKVMLDHPARLFDLAARLPSGVKYFLDPHSPKNWKKGAGYPRELEKIEWKGMLYGPFAYLRSRWQARKYARMNDMNSEPSSSWPTSERVSRS